MSFGRFIILFPIGLGVIFGFVAYALSLTNNESGFVVFTALSAGFILMGIILAVTLPQYARMIEESSADQ